MDLYQWLKPLLFKLDAEKSHDFTLQQLSKLNKFGLLGFVKPKNLPKNNNPIHLAGITFPNRVGLAAGLDKNAQYYPLFAQLGFGFLECGTVTPLPQDGNKKPRLYRLAEHEALINRFGFNNIGLDEFINNIKYHQAMYINANLNSNANQQNNSKMKQPLGINIGKNAKTSLESALDDYLLGLEASYNFADYIVVNISSPNTPNLRRLQNEQELNHLIVHLKAKQGHLAEIYEKNVPLFIKIAPDLTDDMVLQLAQIFLEHNVDGIVATNTTINRDSVKGHEHAYQIGGLSGKPVFEQSNHVIKILRESVGKNFPIIGVGGILSGEDAVKKLEAGADLVQIYSGLIYKGPQLIADCLKSIYEWERMNPTENVLIPDYFPTDNGINVRNEESLIPRELLKS